MEKFVNLHAKGYELVKDNERLGIRTKRLGKFASKSERKFALAMGQVPRHPAAGRPFKFVMECSFCHRWCGLDGQLQQHWRETHHKAKQFCHLPKKDKDYFCPVEDCTTERLNDRDRLRRHLKDESLHSIEELLEAGVEAWMYRSSQQGMIRTCKTWLEQNGFIQKINVSRLKKTPIQTKTVSVKKLKAKKMLKD